MEIDLSEIVERAKTKTREWATASGYIPPDEEKADPLSQKARNVQRILQASHFGCQQRSVHLLVEELLGEKLPLCDGRPLVQYENPRHGVKPGIVVVPVRPNAGHGHPEPDRPCLVGRVSEKGNAGLRESSGNLLSQYLGIHDIRPASDAEIDQYFSEFFALSVNELDEAPDGADLDDEIGF